MSSPAGAAKVVDLAQASPPRLLFALLRQRFTGTLQLQQGGAAAGERAIWFSGGMPVFTNWVENTEVLGQILLEQRVINETALIRALEAMAAAGGLLGQTLVQQGAIDEAQLAAALQHQCGRKLVHLFALREGHATLTPGPHELEAMDGVNVLELMLAAVGRHYDEARVGAEVGQSLHGLLRLTAAYDRYAEHFRFRPTDAPLLDMLRAGTTYTALAQAAEGGARRAAQLTYVLWASQMLYTGAAAAEPAPEPAAPRKAAAPRAAAPPPTAAPAPAPPKPAPAAAPAAAPAPAPAPAAPANDDNAAFEAELAVFEARIEEGAHPFALMGLEIDAGRKQIRAAWADLSRKLHPDALQAHGREHLNERVNAVFAALSEAHTTLSDKEERQRIAEAVARGDDPSASGSTEASNIARNAFESELIAKEADRYLRANKFDLAAAEYGKALELTPDEPDFQAAAIWCAYNLSDRSTGAANHADRALGEIIADAPNLARAQLWRGHVLRELGATDAAIISYQRAFSNDDRLIDAQRFIRALKMARGESVQSPSKPKDERKRGRGLKGLFGKR